MSALLSEAEALYRECFTVYGNEPEIILGFAEKHGRISLIKHNGETAGMICTADINDNGIDAIYIFAACLLPEYRKKGLFREALGKLTSQKAAILIPENESLFPMYEKLGFSPQYCLVAEIEGENISKSFGGNTDELFGIYRNTFQFPKKSKELFTASIGAHLAYGGKIKLFKNTALLISENSVTDVFAPTVSEAVSAAGSAFDGKYKVTLPPNCEAELIKNGIRFVKKKIAMTKNISSSQIYINNLFN